MDSNRVRVSLTREATIGTFPGSARMRPVRITGESLQYTPVFFTPDEIRSDRMSSDPTQININNRGGINYELSYPRNNLPFSEMMRSAFFNPWVLTPEWDNSETAGSITTIATATTITVVDQSGSGGFAGTSVKANHIIRISGATNSANNANFVVASSTSTTIVSSGLTNETLPTTGRLKVVGLQGNSGDLVATSNSITSTALNWTTMGLQVGQWINIGDSSNAAFSFATTANNSWARITSIAATALGLDNLPVGWGADAGTGKTIRIWFGDVLKNGTTRTSLSIERSFLSQATPTHILHRGMVVNRWTETMTSGRAITGSFDFMGISAAQGTAANGTTYDTVATHQVMTANVSVGRIGEAGVAISSPNWARRLDITCDNNLRIIESLGVVGGVEMGVGEFGATGTLETYFGSNALYAKLVGGTQSSLSARVAINNQAYIRTLPRVTFSDGSPNAGGKNQDVTVPLAFVSSIDSVTSCEAQVDRLEYFAT